MSKPAVQPLDPGRLTEELLDAVRRLDAVEESLDHVVDSLEAGPVPASPASAEEAAAGRWAWEQVDAEAAAALWRQVADFVTWLDLRYAHHLSGDEHVVPPCWYRHPVAVELLTALTAARQGAYADAQPGDALVDFHERSLWPTFARLRALRVFAHCTRGHADDTRPGPVWDADTDTGFGAFVAEATGRPLPAAGPGPA